MVLAQKEDLKPTGVEYFIVWFSNIIFASNLLFFIILVSLYFDEDRTMPLRMNIFGEAQLETIMFILWFVLSIVWYILVGNHYLKARDYKRLAWTKFAIGVIVFMFIAVFIIQEVGVLLWKNV